MNLDVLGRRITYPWPEGDTPGDWVEQAHCTSVDPELWYPDTPGAAARDGKRICHTCPVNADCLAFALETRQTYGTWGGVDEWERRRLRRRR